MNSALYECDVMHHRLEPKEHHFNYRIFMFALDLDEIDGVAKRIPFFSRNRWNLYSFFDRDHMTFPGQEKTSIRENLKAYLLKQNAVLPPNNRVLLVTLPRILGYIFNPVCFYFCFDEAGTPLCSVVEVCNTFKEMKPYFMGAPKSEGFFRHTVPKHFYVSPFSNLKLSFDFKLRVPNERLDIHIDDREEDRPVLLSALTGKRTPLTSRRLLWFTLKYPLLTLRVIFLIHWHAFLLWLKGLPWYAKADQPELQRDVLRPHASILPQKP